MTLFVPILTLCMSSLSSAGAVGADLDSLLKQFLLPSDAQQKAAARKALLADLDATTEALEQALQSVDLWSDQPLPSSPVTLGLLGEDGVGLAVHFRLPRGYDPRRAWPLMLTLHGTGDHAASWLRGSTAILGEHTDRMIVAAVEKLDGPGFNLTAAQENRPRRLVAALRKLFHIDSDRVFVMGYSLGGHRSFIMAAMHPDLLAGAMPLAGTLALPLNDLLFEPMLGNTRLTRMLVVWGEKDIDFGITPRNHALRELAARLKLASLDFVELPGIGHLGVRPPAAAMAELLKARRDPWPRDVRHCFRTHLTGRAWWLRALRMTGQPIPTTTLRVRPKPGEDPALAMKQEVERRIGRIEARIDGQTITLTTARTAEVELLLHPALLDLKKPIKVVRRDKVVFEGVIDPDPAFLLDCAEREWDFSALPHAQLTAPMRPARSTGKP